MREIMQHHFRSQVQDNILCVLSQDGEREKRIKRSKQRDMRKVKCVTFTAKSETEAARTETIF